MVTAGNDDGMNEAVSELLCPFYQDFHGELNVLYGIGGTVFDPDVIIWDAGSDELIGVAFGFGFGLVFAVRANAAADQEIVDVALLVEFESFFYAARAATEDDANMGASVTVGQILLRAQENDVFQPGLNEVRESVDDVADEIKETQYNHLISEWQDF